MGRTTLLLILVLSLIASAVDDTTTSPPAPVSFGAAPTGLTDYPWAMFHHDSLRTGATPASAPSGANLMWSFATGSVVYASPAVAGGTVFIPSWDGKLYAIDEYTGQQEWAYQTGAPIYASAAVANGLVYLASRDSGVYALDQTTGNLVWGISNISPITSSPVVADGKVFYGTWFRGAWAKLLAVDAQTGNILWQYTADDGIVSSPSVHNGRVFFGQNNGFVVAVNETTGAELWKVLNPGNPGCIMSCVISTAPTVAYGTVFVGTDYQFLALDELTGGVKWLFSTKNNTASSPAVSNGIVYFGTGAGNVTAADAVTGAKIWIFKAGGGVTSSPALALGSNTLLVGSQDGSLYALNMTGGAFLWKYPTGSAVSSSPAVADGRVFFGSQDFKVYAIGSQALGLQVSLSSSAASVRSGEIDTLTISVTDGTSPVSGVSISFSSSVNGTFTLPVEKTSGVYVSNFTAPLVSYSVDTTIRAVARRAGYLDSTTQTVVTLNPPPALPPLSVEATPTQATTSPGGEVLLQIKVTNGTQPTPGANITFSSTDGGSFTGLTDEGNGNYTVKYSASLQSSNPTLIIRASKTGFAPGQALVSITISGGQNTTNTIPGLNIGLNIPTIAIGFVVFFLLITAIAVKKK